MVSVPGDVLAHAAEDGEGWRFAKVWREPRPVWRVVIRPVAVAGREDSMLLKLAFGYTGVCVASD